MYNKKIFKRCFSYRKRYWYLNIKNIPLYFKSIHFLLKHGYDNYATYETFTWFISTMKDILIKYKNCHYGTPVLLTNYPLQSSEDNKIEQVNKEFWNSIIDEMLLLLDEMDETNELYKNMKYKDIHKNMEEAKDKFFILFSKYFYELWD